MLLWTFETPFPFEVFFTLSPIVIFHYVSSMCLALLLWCLASPNLHHSHPWALLKPLLETQPHERLCLSPLVSEPLSSAAGAFVRCCRRTELSLQCHKPLSLRQASWNVCGKNQSRPCCKLSIIFFKFFPHQEKESHSNWYHCHLMQNNNLKRIGNMVLSGCLTKWVKMPWN